MARLKVEDINTQAIVEEKKKATEEAPQGFYLVDGLPSKGRLYPEGTKIYSRPLKILEVKQLATINETNYNQIINAVLKKTVIGIDVNELVSADKLFIIYWQRANTYKGDGFAVDFRCDSCGNKSKYDFSISNLILQDIKDDYDPSAILTLPDSGDKILLHQMKVMDERLVENFKAGNRVGEYDDDLLVLSSLMTTVNDKEMTLKDKYLYLTELSIKDNLYLAKMYAKNEISLEPNLKVTCKQCGGVVETALTFRADFFIPEYSI
jgi:hypothetical protein